MKTFIKMQFRPEIAKDVWTDSAIIYSNIEFWIEKNKANNKNYNEWRYWTYNSITAFQKLFTYLTSARIKLCLKKLIDKWYLIKWNFNKVSYDKTSWYAICQKQPMDRQKQPMEELEKENGRVEINQPIPDYNTDNKPVCNKATPQNIEDVINYFNERWSCKDEAEHFFDHFTSNGWKVWGKAPMKDWKASARNWLRNNLCTNKVIDTNNLDDLLAEHDKMWMTAFEDKYWKEAMQKILWRVINR